MPNLQPPADADRRAIAPQPQPNVDPVMEELWRVKDARSERFADARALVEHLRARFPEVVVRG